MHFGSSNGHDALLLPPTGAGLPEQRFKKLDNCGCYGTAQDTYEVSLGRGWNTLIVRAGGNTDNEM